MRARDENACMCMIARVCTSCSFVVRHIQSTSVFPPLSLPSFPSRFVHRRKHGSRMPTSCPHRRPTAAFSFLPSSFSFVLHPPPSRGCDKCVCVHACAHKCLGVSKHLLFQPHLNASVALSANTHIHMHTQFKLLPVSPSSLPSSHKHTQTHTHTHPHTNNHLRARRPVELFCFLGGKHCTNTTASCLPFTFPSPSTSKKSIQKKRQVVAAHHDA